MVRVADGRWLKSGVVIGACALTSLAGCEPAATPPTKTSPEGASQPKSADAHDDHDHDHDHDHDAPHGGALVVVGDEAAHVEFVLDKETGKLTAYVLDDHAHEAVAVKHAELKIAVTIEKEGVEFPEAKEVTLTAVDAKDGAASEFVATIEELKGAEHFEAALDSISVGGKEYKGVTFKFPEGNEEHHH